MKVEVEAKFLHVTVEKMRAQLHAVGAKLITPMRLMRRVVINTPEMANNNGFLRVRDEGGGKITLTYKQFDEFSVHGAKEIEVTVEDFDATIALLHAAGFTNQSYQETRRETWALEGVEVVIDEWPWLDPYIELEGTDEAGLRAAAKKLGFDWADAVFGGVTEAYRAQYPHLNPKDVVSHIPIVRFEDALPPILKP